MPRPIDSDQRPTPWLLCLDLQPDAAALSRPPEDLDRRLGLCRTVVRHARTAGWSVVHVLRRPSEPHDRHELGTTPPFPGLEPAPFETVLFRQGLSAFSHPRFDQFAQPGQDEEAFTVALSLDPACLLTAIDAHERGVRMRLLDDTLSAPAVERFDAATVRGVLLDVAEPYIRRISLAALLDMTICAGKRRAANQH